MNDTNTLTAKKALSIISNLWGTLPIGTMGEMRIYVENNTRYVERPKSRIKVFIFDLKRLDIDERTSEIELRELITDIKKSIK